MRTVAIDLAAASLDSLPDVLSGLRRSTGESLEVSIACAPVGPYGEGALIVRPLSVWKTLLALAGFEIVSQEDHPHASVEDPDEWSAAHHWARFDPFRTGGAAHRHTLVLRPQRPAGAGSSSHDEMRRVLGARCGAAIETTSFDPDGHLVFLVGTYQEFRQYQTFWAALPRDSYTVLLRDGGADAAWTRRRRCMEAWLSARHVDWRAVSDAGSVRWGDWTQRHRMLVAGADSNVFRSHLLNGAFVAAARFQGWKTVQVQHGIWPYADVVAPMTMMSELVLTWSGEFKARLDERVTWSNGRRGARGDVAGVRFEAVGCAAFDRYADARWPTLEDLLGNRVAAYRRRVLVATNLHWSQHRDGQRVNPAILELARRHDDTLFIVKTHPAHDPEDAFVRACPANVQVLDEFCCLFADLDSARLVLASDAVISTLSTVALEAAVARRPFLVLDTGNPNRYEHVDTVPPEQLGTAYRALFERAADAHAFVDHYVAPGSVGRSTRTALQAIYRELESAPGAPVRAASLRSFADLASAQAVEGFAQRTRIDALEQGVADTAAALRDQQELSDRVGRRNDRLRQILREKDALRIGALPRAARVGLFGASTAGIRDVARLREQPGVSVVCLFDNDPSRWNTVAAGVCVRKPEPAAFAGIDLIVIASVHADEITRQLVDAGQGAKIMLDADSLVEALALAASSHPQRTAV